MLQAFCVFISTHLQHNGIWIVGWIHHPLHIECKVQWLDDLGWRAVERVQIWKWMAVMVSYLHSYLYPVLPADVNATYFWMQTHMVSVNSCVWTTHGHIQGKVRRKSLNWPTNGWDQSLECISLPTSGRSAHALSDHNGGSEDNCICINDIFQALSGCCLRYRHISIFRCIYT